MTAHEVTDKQIAEAWEAQYVPGMGSKHAQGFKAGYRAALAARQVPEDVAALVADLRMSAQYLGTRFSGAPAGIMNRAAAALEVSSRTVAPNREALRKVSWTYPDGTVHMLSSEAINALADLWQPAPVIDRDALIETLVRIFHGTDEAPEFPVGHDINLTFCQVEDELADALLASGWQPASPRTVTTVEELDALPMKSVVRLNDERGGGYVYEKFTFGWGRPFGGRIPVGSVILIGYGPATVLYVPSEGVES